MRRIAFYSVLTLAVALPFQNCAKSNFRNSRDTNLTRYSGGQPYDGKPYVYQGSCADGSPAARILYHNSASASVVREDCAPVDPARPITGQDFQLDPANSDRLFYGGREFTAELAIAPKTSFRPSLSQIPSPGDPASVLIADAFDLSADDIKTLKSAGHAVLCNISIGTRESWRPDASQFPPAVLGNNDGGSERFLDIRSTVVRDLMVARLNMAKAKGCDGVDLDRADIFENNPGFPLSAAEQTSYNRFLLSTARTLGLLTGVRSGTTIAAAMAPFADVAIVEQCFQYNECQAFQPYADAGKAIFVSEYTPYSAAQCAAAENAGISLVFTNTANTTVQSCP